MFFILRENEEYYLIRIETRAHRCIELDIDTYLKRVKYEP
jgi:hypothetical protein